MEKKEAHVTVSGSVQGVWFRASTVEVAREAGARGYVRNLPGNKVEAVIQGTADQIENVIAFMRTGPRGAVVSNIEITWRSPERDYTTFQVSY